MKMKNEDSRKAIPYAVRRLLPADRHRVVDHFLALDAADRGLRFGAAADDAAVERYVQSIDFVRDAVLAVEAEDGALSAVAHVAHHGGLAELGVSVACDRRQRGLASSLADAALRAAREAGASEFRFHCAATNEGMRRIASRLGMTIESEGSELTARRRLKRRPGPANEPAVRVAA